MYIYVDVQQFLTAGVSLMFLLSLSLRPTYFLTCFHYSFVLSDGGFLSLFLLCVSCFASISLLSLMAYRLSFLSVYSLFSLFLCFWVVVPLGGWCSAVGWPWRALLLESLVRARVCCCGPRRQIDITSEGGICLTVYRQIIYLPALRYCYYYRHCRIVLVLYVSQQRWISSYPLYAALRIQQG